MTKIDDKYEAFLEGEESKFVRNKFKGAFKKFLVDSSPLRTAKRTHQEEKRVTRQQEKAFEFERTVTSKNLMADLPFDQDLDDPPQIDKSYKLYLNPKKDSMSNLNKNTLNESAKKSEKVRSRMRNHSQMVAITDLEELRKLRALPLDKESRRDVL